MPFETSDIGKFITALNARDRSAVPSAFLFVPQVTVTDTFGAMDPLVRIHQHPNADLISLVTVTLSPLSGAGSFRTDGGIVTAATPGLFLPAGGGVINLYALHDIRFFRIQANAGETILLTAQAYRTGGFD